MPTLIDIQEIFANWYQNLKFFWDLITMENYAQSLGEWVGQLVEDYPLLSWITEVITFISGSFVSFVFGDKSLLEIILGGALIGFVAITIFKWLQSIARMILTAGG